MQPQQQPTNKDCGQPQVQQKKKKVRRDLTIEEAIQLTMKQFKKDIEYLKDR